MTDDVPDLTRPRFVLYRPPGDLGTDVPGMEAEFPWRLARRGHSVTLYSDVDCPAAEGVTRLDPRQADLTLEGFWLLMGTDGPMRALAANSRSGLIMTNRKPVSGGEWERAVSLFTATCYDFFPGVVASTHRGHRYQHINHFTFGHKDEAESRRKWLDVGPGDLFLDIGASLGSWTLPAAACGAQVYAFDAGTDITQLLRHVEMNGFGGRVLALPRLVSDTDDVPVAAADIPWRSVPPQQENRGSKTISIDRFVSGLDGHQASRLKLIKVDVDGSEMKVLRGMEGTLRKFRPRLVVEIHDFLGVSSTEVTAYLSGLGYDCEVVPMEEGYYFHSHCTPRG